MLFGNLGSEQVYYYSVMGDSVNLASRLESANKVLGTSICVGGTTVEGCTEFQFRPVGELLLKGKTKIVESFAHVAATEAAGPRMESYLAAYQRMKREGDGAAGAFKELAVRYPDDPVPPAFGRFDTVGIPTRVTGKGVRNAWAAQIAVKDHATLAAFAAAKRRARRAAD